MQLNEAIQRLWYWRKGGTSFTCQLFDLMAKADPQNLQKLSESFPVEAQAYLFWRASGSEKGFFKAYGLEIAS